MDRGEWVRGSGEAAAREGIDPDSKNAAYGQTPLSLAAEDGNKEMVTLLLYKVVPDSKDARYGRTPFSCAAENGHEVVVKLLLEKVSTQMLRILSTVGRRYRGLRKKDMRWW
jgi:ankyrin repeat protein